MIRRTSLAITRVLLIGLFLFQGVFPGNAQMSEELREKIDTIKWIAYAPTNFDPIRAIFPGEDSVRKDLELLYDYGFRGLVTYGSDAILARVPEIARSVGFSGIIMGVWDIDSCEEITGATLACPFVDGYCLGNEGLNVRYTMEQLCAAIDSLKAATHKPVTTTEQVFDYANDELLALGDWVFPNIHPFLAEVKDPRRAAIWIQKHYQQLKKHCPPERIVFFKEVGWPTSGMFKANEANQKEFFRFMEKAPFPFVYFEAFDQRWKINPSCEPYWGLFTAKRKAKRSIAVFKKKGNYERAASLR